MSVTLKRVIWKREPTEEEVEMMRRSTLYGPSCFKRGLEWLFLHNKENPMCHADTPSGYERIN